MSQSVINNITNYMERHQQGARLTLTAIAASVLTASTLIGYQRITRSRLQDDKKALKRAVDEEQPAAISIIDEEKMEEQKREPMDESLVLELLARNTAFFGHESVCKIRKSFVVILGAGAIGSWTALMLVRSGVEHVRIVDPGYVRLESMTRNAVAKIPDIGKSKALILKKYIGDIAPNAEVQVERTHLTQDSMADLLAGTPDFVVDTLPAVKDKVLVAKYCKEHNIKIVSAMSAGAKADPTLIQVTDVNDTMTDPLARMYRRQLRKFGIDRGVPVVYSTEKSLHLDSKDFSTRSLPILGPVASMFGMALVTYVIVQLAEFTAYKLPANKMRDGVYSRLQKELAAREQVIFKNTTNILSVNEVGYVFDEFWQGKSAISGAQDRALVMTRWDSSQVSNLVNTVVMTKDEANLHDKLPQGTDLAAHYGSNIVDKINAQFALESKLQQLWNSPAA
ncbi:molybdopterin-converting factor [Mucor ambiguus]|uniref:Molybdopterin-converting factor n=1 Tax=Mucor ambiguus TaxID=91626 RepID=A0A0C9LWV6_9FUNG|nr:molybdopterin-converting factor [Mucor ambiguus]